MTNSFENNPFDPARRRTLKAFAATAAAGVLTTKAGLASELTGRYLRQEAGTMIDCKLICRADSARAHLLLHNKTDADIAVARFSTQHIGFDDTTMDMADAFVEPVIVSAHDRVMVRLNFAAGVRALPDSPIDLNAATSYLPLGTRVVDMPVRMHRGVGTIDYKAPVHS